LFSKKDGIGEKRGFRTVGSGVERSWFKAGGGLNGQGKGLSTGFPTFGHATFEKRGEKRGRELEKKGKGVGGKKRRHQKVGMRTALSLNQTL